MRDAESDARADKPKDARGHWDLMDPATPLPNLHTSEKSPLHSKVVISKEKSQLRQPEKNHHLSGDITTF